MVRALVIALSALLGGCVASHTSPTSTDTRPPCEGAVVTVWGEDSLTCDVSPPQLLVVLGITESRCDDLGGAWVYEACEGVDY